MQLTLSHIKRGPAHLEQFLSSFVDASVVQSGEKLNLYKALIQKVELKKSILQSGINKASHFCLAHLCYEAARYSSDNQEKKLYLEAALSHYEILLPRRVPETEEYFYAYYCSGIIMQSLGVQWKKVEERFLIAHEIRPFRAEPIGAIIRYFQYAKKWPIAYIFSTYASDHFLGNLPLNEKWGIDNDLYNWKVLDYHTASCFALGKTKEATETFSTLYRKTLDHPDLFHPEQLKQISSQKKLFPKI